MTDRVQFRLDGKTWTAMKVRLAHERINMQTWLSRLVREELARPPRTVPEDERRAGT